jgi:hypothetical protein
MCLESLNGSGRIPSMWKQLGTGTGILIISIFAGTTSFTTLSLATFPFADTGIF